jgi:succinoglycan biosynthesis transport protein ExoP
MELGNYLKVLSRHKFTLIIVPLLTIIITYFLVRNQPDAYTSEAQIATGIVDKSQQVLNNGAESQQSQISQDFDNLIEMLRSKKITDEVSYQLMIHDLTSTEPFRKPSKTLTQLNEQARQHALEVYTKFYNDHKELSLYNADQNGLHVLLTSMKYDNQSLLRMLTIYRAESSDFINVDFSSENSQLSAFVVNTLVHEFTSYYNSVVKENQSKAITFLGKLVETKKDTLDSKIDQLRNYKIANRILSLPEQSRALYSEIADFDTHLQQAEREAISTAAAIRNIEAQFKPNDRKYMESLMVPVNQDIINLRDQLQLLNEQYIENNFNPADKIKIDSVQRRMNERIMQSSDKYIVSPLSSQQALVAQRLTLQVQYDLAKNSIGSIQQQLVRLNNQLDGIVPHEAIVQQDESAVEIARQEYLDILNKYNQTSLDANYIGELKQLETAMPGVAEPSKKMLLVILSGIISFIFCLVVFFILYFFDDTIKTPGELANKTAVPVLGYLNLLSSSTIDLRRVWTDTNPDAETYQFRNLLQSIRFEVDGELAGNKVLLINSLAGGEGKTFVATNLAYAYSLVNKRVLLIDGNFNNPGITKSVKSKLYIEDYLNGDMPDFSPQNSSKITVFGNKGGDGSLYEVSTENIIAEKFDKLREAFDVIIIEASSLDTLNKSKEWNRYADKILAIFEAGKNIKYYQKPNVEYLKNLNGKFMGWVLNVVHKTDAAAEESKNGSGA